MLKLVGYQELSIYIQQYCYTGQESLALCLRAHFDLFWVRTDVSSSPPQIQALPRDFRCWLWSGSAVSQVFWGVELGKASLRIIFIVGCVEFPLSWNRNGQETCRGEGSTPSDILDTGKRGAGIFLWKLWLKPGSFLCSDLHLQGLWWPRARLNFPFHSVSFAPTSGRGWIHLIPHRVTCSLQSFPSCSGLLLHWSENCSVVCSLITEGTLCCSALRDWVGFSFRLEFCCPREQICSAGAIKHPVVTGSECWSILREGFSCSGVWSCVFQGCKNKVLTL